MNEMIITKFLSAFFNNEYHTITLMTLAPKGANTKPIYYSTNCKVLPKNNRLYERLRKANETQGIYFCPNFRRGNDEDIITYNAFFVEMTGLPKEEQHNVLDKSPLQPSIKVVTKNSIHAYWLIKGDCSRTEWIEIQSRLIAFYKGDKHVDNPACYMKLPFFDDVSYNGRNYDYEKIEVADLNPRRRFSVEEMKKAFLSTKIPAESKSEIVGPASPQNSYNTYQTEFSVESPAKEMLVAHKQNSLQSNKESLNKSAPAVENNDGESCHRSKCFYGLAGEIVKTIEPHTEADSIALLLNVLVAFGNVIGRKAFFEVEGAKHYTNLYGVLVGPTSAGKGSSWTQIRRLFAMIDEMWSSNRIQSGLSSGEGLIAAVKGGDVPTDKRLLVVESEFSSVLSMTKREGNTLSQIIRGFWDEGSGQTMTKNNPISVNDAHISILGHITPNELRTRLNQIEIANGFVNRFIWLEVKRSKLLPDGGKLSNEDLNALAGKLLEAVEFARTVEEMKRTEEAWVLWREKYHKIAIEKSGAFGNATMRARSQIARISMIFALMDKSKVVRREHLEAALDFWSYCENSARQIFGESTGNKLADEIYKHLKASKEGLSKTDIHNITNKNYTSKQIDDAISILKADGLAYSRDGKRGGSSKSVEVWFANEFNESKGT